VYPLGENVFTIGRDPGNSIVLPDLRVSRLHCQIIPEAGGYRVKDLGSHNSTLLNGVQVTESALRDGDSLTIGETILQFGVRPDQPPAPTEDSGEISETETTSVLLPDAVHLLAVGIDSGRAAGRLERDLKTLLRAGRALSTVRGEELRKLILDSVFECVPADRAAILSDPGDLEQVEVSYRDESLRPAMPAPIPRQFVRRAFTEGVALRGNQLLRGGAGSSDSVVRARANSLLVVPMTLHGEVLGAIYADSSRAVEFDEDHLHLLTGLAGMAAGPLAAALRLERLEMENSRLRRDLGIATDMVGNAAPMRKLADAMARIARTDSTVLILGETGTGKELVARAIHARSERREGPFVAVNCAALAESLIESELFGHEKGAFTGAWAPKKGRIEEAAGGTLFLDEIAELAPALQVKLLRVLQDLVFERVGSNKPRRADVRVIAATNRNLEDMIKAGTFRQDLYFRLNVVSLRTPPLRDRLEDIPLLVNYFIAKLSAKLGRRVTACSEPAMRRLRRYHWPGNVRELENAIERAIVLGLTPEILPEDLPDAILEADGLDPDLQTPAGEIAFHDRIREYKKQLVQRALARAGANVSEAARLLGIHPNNLYRLMRTLDLKPPE